MNKNTVIIDGRILEKPVLRKTNKSEVLNLTIANNHFKNYKGETVYVPVVIFGSTAKYIAENANVGDTLSSIGKLETYDRLVYASKGNIAKREDGSNLTVPCLRVNITESDIYLSNKNREAKLAAGGTYESKVVEEPKATTQPEVSEAPKANDAPDLDDSLDLDDLDLDLDLFGE